jgi:hypothetical protein
LLKFDSYIKKPKVIISSLSSLNQNFNEYFIRLDDEETIKSFISDIDRDYIEGVIFAEYNGIVIMDFTYWDIIDQLWAYIISSIQDYIQNGESEFYFPDQPIRVKMKKINSNLLLFSIESKKSIKLTLSSEELFQTLLESGKEFFTNLQDCFDGILDYSGELELIKEIKDKLNQ